MITKTAREQLLAIVVPHENQSEGYLTETGMIKTRGGLIIPPSTSYGGGNDTRTGVPDELTPEERHAYHLDSKRAPEQSVKRTRKSKTKTEAPSEPTGETVTVSIPGMGSIPTQYAHIWKGKDILVLGLGKLSYVPSVGGMSEDDTIVGSITISGQSGRFVYAGTDFVDGSGIRNIILMRVPEEEEETYDDGQEQR